MPPPCFPLWCGQLLDHLWLFSALSHLPPLIRLEAENRMTDPFVTRLMIPILK